MDLSSATSLEDLNKIYEENHLESIDERVSFLRKAMKIRATRCDVSDTPEEELIGLQELALTHLWKGLQK